MYYTDYIFTHEIVSVNWTTSCKMFTRFFFRLFFSSKPDIDRIIFIAAISNKRKTSLSRVDKSHQNRTHNYVKSHEIYALCWLALFYEERIRFDMWLCINMKVLVVAWTFVLFGWNEMMSRTDLCDHMHAGSLAFIEWTFLGLNENLKWDKLFKIPQNLRLAPENIKFDLNLLKKSWKHQLIRRCHQQIFAQFVDYIPLDLQHIAPIHYNWLLKSHSCVNFLYFSLNKRKWKGLERRKASLSLSFIFFRTHNLI